MKLINISIQDDFLPSKGAYISDGFAKIENRLLLIKFSEQQLTLESDKLLCRFFCAKQFFLHYLPSSP